MTVVASDIPLTRRGARTLAPRAAISALVYVVFAAVVFIVEGPRPPLGSDHLSYLLLADSILSACPDGGYWREASSTQTYGVLLAYLHAWTGSHIVSMKLVLAVVTVLYLFAAELFFNFFEPSPGRARLFALLSAFAVSFGAASWGLTDSTALLPRSLVAPVAMLAFWLWFRFDGRALKYTAFPLLVLGSLLHLSAFYVMAVLVLLELWDFLVLRRARLDRRVAALAASLLLAVSLLYAFEQAGFSSKLIGVQIPQMLRSLGYKVENLDQRPTFGCSRPRAAFAPEASARWMPVAFTATAAADAASPSPLQRADPRAGSVPPEISAAQAWETELRVRPWRNMPLPLVNVANLFASCALILVLALAGVRAAWRSGLTRADRLMLGLFAAVVLFAFGPQTALWIARSYAPVHPVNIEEIRAFGLIMIPALYFVLRLVQAVQARGGPYARAKIAAIVVAVLALPLLMKGMPRWMREDVFTAMTALRMVDRGDEARIANARTVLGLREADAPFYYATLGVREWLAAHSPRGARILTDRDDLILLRDRVVLGPRQVEIAAYYATSESAEIFLQTSRAIAARDLARLKAIARAQRVDFVVVPWRVPGAAFSDEHFSIVSMRTDAA